MDVAGQSGAGVSRWFETTFSSVTSGLAFDQWAIASLELLVSVLAMALILALVSQSLFDFGMRRNRLRASTRHWFQIHQHGTSSGAEYVASRVQQGLVALSHLPLAQLLEAFKRDNDSPLGLVELVIGFGKPDQERSRELADEALQKARIQLAGAGVSVFSLGPEEIAASFDARLRSAVDSETMVQLANDGRTLHLSREDVWLISALTRHINADDEEGLERFSELYFELLMTRRIIRLSERGMEGAVEALDPIKLRYEELYRWVSARLDEAMDSFQASLMEQWGRFQYSFALLVGAAFITLAFLGPSPITVSVDGAITALLIWAGASLASVVLRSGLARLLLRQSA